MPSNLNKKTKTSVGYETPQQTLDRARAMTSRQPMKQATPAPTTSGSLKDLSIALAQQNRSSGGSAPLGSTGSGSLKDLSISLAQGGGITQEDVNRAQAGGPSLTSLTASRAAAPASVPTVSAPAGPTSAQTAVGGTGRRVSRYGLTGTDEPVVETPSFEDIQKQLMRDAQRQVNALREYENSLLQEQSQINQEAERQQASVNTLTGLAGSTEANVAAQRVAAQGQRANQQIQAQVQTQIQSVLADVRDAARQMYQFERGEARADRAQAFTENKEMFNRAQNNVALLAASGATIEGYQATDPEGYNYLSQTLGGEEVMKAMFTLNRPQETIVDKKMEGGKYIVAYQNPLDGKIRVETVDLGLPPQYTKTIDAGNRILAIPDNWSGDPAELITINKGLTPGQAAGAATGGGETTVFTSDLDALIGATESVIGSKFGQETFRRNVDRARSEADKINLVASVVLGKADSATKTDFANQAVGIKQLDAAIAEIDRGVQTGAIQAGAQYLFNVFGQDFDPRLASINQKITSAIQPYRASVTGAAWGQQEEDEYKNLFGSTRFAPEELRQRLVGMRDILASKSAAALGSYVNPLGFYGNPFQTGNLQTMAPTDLRSQVDAMGYNYDLMVADGLSDEEIRSALSL